MTPAARISAAIDLMDRIQGGEVADRALADWGRKNRYAGSKDRAAIADIVYDVLRRKQSCAAFGGGESGRALLLGHVRISGQDPDTVFGADRYAPAELTAQERAHDHASASDVPDFPDWLWPEFERTHADRAHAVARALTQRAPIHLRANLMRLNREQAIAELAKDGITGRSVSLSPSAIEVTDGARKIRQSRAYLNGDVELQDAASQAVADLVPVQPGQSLLDFCAGGGGKTLAVAGRVEGVFFAHDIDPQRMKDLAPRAERAGTRVTKLSLPDIERHDPFDSVLIDAPCSGSGSWRRDPQGKWLLSAQMLEQINQTQAEILDQAAHFVKPQGHLVYATCSLLERENDDQTRAFLSRNSRFSMTFEKHFTPLDGGDGFYCSVLVRA